MSVTKVAGRTQEPLEKPWSHAPVPNLTSTPLHAVWTDRVAGVLDSTLSHSISRMRVDWLDPTNLQNSDTEYHAMNVQAQLLLPHWYDSECSELVTV